MLDKLRAFFAGHPTRPVLAEILLEALKLWLADQQVIIPVHPILYASLISKQYRAGWEQLFVGRFVLKWSELQEDFLSSLPTRSKYHSGTTWVSGVNQIICKHVYKTWENQNAAQHGVDAASREIALAKMA